MKINFTKKEFKTLLELIQIAEWVLYSHEEEDTGSTKYKKLIWKICSYAKDFGMEDAVEFIGDREYFLSDDVLDEVYNYIEEFSNNEFWETLVEMLAKRDLLEKYGEEKLNQFDSMERFSLIEEAGDIYNKEFEVHGIKNLRLFFMKK